MFPDHVPETEFALQNGHWQWAGHPVKLSGV